MIPEVKNYLDLTEANTIPRYLMKIDKWERSNPHRKSLYRNKGVHGTNNQYRQGTQGSFQNRFRKNVTCFQCGKLGHISHEPLCQLLSSNRLNPRLRRIAMKLQHWLLKIEYLPGKDNGFADALSREERPRMVSFNRTDTSLASGDVGTDPT